MNNLAPFLMTAGYFRRPIRKYLLMVALLVAGMFVLCTLPLYHYAYGLIDGLIIIILFFAMMLSPVAFSAEKSEVLAWMLPVKAWQKFVTMLAFCIVIVPLLMIVEWSVLHYATCWFVDTPGPRLLLHLGELKLFFNSQFMWVGFVAGAMQNLLPMAIVMIVVTSCKSGVMAKSVLAVMTTTFVLLVFGAIIGVLATAFAMRAGNFENIDLAESNSDEFLMLINEGSGGLLLTYYIILSVAAAIILLGSFYLVYRKLAQRQI